MKYLISLVFVSILVLSSCKKEEAMPPSTPPEDNTVDLPEQFAAWKNIFEGNGVGAAVNLHEDVLLLFSMEGDQYAWFEEEEIKAVYNMSDSNGPLSSYSLGSVGAAVVLNQNALYLISDDGDRYMAGSFDNDFIEGSWNNADAISFSGSVHDLYEWGPDNTCPFNSVGAMWNYSGPGSGCFDAFEEYNHYWMINNTGDEMVLYYSPSGGNFHDVEELENWTAENNCGGADGLLPFEAVSAVCRIVYPNRITEVFFSEDGTQFTYYNVSEGEFSEVYDLY